MSGLKYFLPLIAADPQLGDKVRNRNSTGLQTRYVTDRNLGGDVFYNSGRWRDVRCTHESWKIFCGKGAVVIETKRAALKPE